MKITDLLKEKVHCYATDQIQQCKPDTCPFYYTCLAEKTRIQNGNTTREIVLKNEKCR